MLIKDVLCGSILGALVPSAVALGAPIYELHDLGSNSFVESVNKHGQAVGGTLDGRAFVWSVENGFRYLQTPDGAGAASAISINDRGDVVGTIGDFGAFWDRNGNAHVLEFRWEAPRLNNFGVVAANGALGGFLWSPDAGAQPIIAPGGTTDNFFVSDFNDVGQVLGFVGDAGWLLGADGSAESLGPANRGFSPMSLNELGYIAGTEYSAERDASRGVVRAPDGSIVPYGDYDQWTQEINNSLLAAGQIGALEGPAILLDGTSVYSLLDLAADRGYWTHLRRVFDLSDSGHVVGTGIQLRPGEEFTLHSYVMKPIQVSEPGSLLLFAGVLFGVDWARRRRV